METAAWESMLERPPPQLTEDERCAWIKQLTGVALSSDAFFPFRDNIDRAKQVSQVLVHKRRVVKKSFIGIPETTKWI